MAYNFNGSTQYLRTSSTPVFDVPVTLAAWYYRRVSGGTHVILCIGDSNNPDRRYNITSQTVGCLALHNDGFNGGNSSTGTSQVGAWQHCCGVFSSTVSRVAYFNGIAGPINTSTMNLSMSSLNIIGVGARIGTAVQNYSNGLIAEVGIWNAALTQAEVVSLARGMTCNKVRPQNLVFYAPLIRDLQDVKGGLSITNNNGATVANHPRIYV